MRQRIVDAGVEALAGRMSEMAALAKVWNLSRARLVVGSMVEAIVQAQWSSFDLYEVPRGPRLLMLWPCGKALPEGRVEFGVWHGGGYHPYEPTHFAQVMAPAALIYPEQQPAGLVSVNHPGIKVRLPPPLPTENGHV